MRKQHYAAYSIALFAAVACAVSADASPEAPIKRPFNLEVPPAVRVDTGNNRVCAGTALTRDWILTAKSCFAEGQNPSTIAITMNGTSYRSMGKELILNPDVNAALVRVVDPLTVATNWYGDLDNGSADYDANLHAGAVDAVGSQDLRCRRVDGTVFSGNVLYEDAAAFLLASSGVTPRLGEACSSILGDRFLLSGIVVNTTTSGTVYLKLDAIRSWAAEALLPKELRTSDGRCLGSKPVRIDPSQPYRAETQTCDDKSNQRWRFERVKAGEAKFRIRDTELAKCIEVQGAEVRLVPCSMSAEAQKFTFVPRQGAPNFFRVQTSGAGRCLSAFGAGPTQLATEDCANAQAFLPVVHPEAPGFEIASVSSNKCVDVSRTSGFLSQTTCTLDDDQEFRFEDLGRNEFQIHPISGQMTSLVRGSLSGGYANVVHTDMCEEPVADPSVIGRTALTSKQCMVPGSTGDFVQRYRLLFQPDGSYAIQSTRDEGCIDAPGGVTTDTRLEVNPTCDLQPKQRWMLRL